MLTHAVIAIIQSTTILTFLCFYRPVEGFIKSGSTIGARLNAGGVLASSTAAATCLTRRPRSCFRRNLIGSDGEEIDIRRHREAYSYPEYWEEFYKGGEAGEVREGELYDWFFGYSRLAVYLNLYLGGAREGRVLVMGCGNSEVSLKMWENGWKNILNIDFCEPVIKAMEQNYGDRPGLEWKVMDARDMSKLEAGSFDAVIDKGMTDSVMHSDKFAKMIAEVSYEVARVLKPGGVYLMTDYRDPERVQSLFKRDEWEGGTLTQEGKITSSVYLFKGKRSMAESIPQADEKAEEAMGEDEDDEDPPEWLVDALKNGGAKLRMEDSMEGIDVPPVDISKDKPADVGRDKPFKF